MEIYKILFYIGTALLISSLLLMVSIQFNAASKDGVYSSMFKDLDIKQMKKVKTSGYLFVLGLVVVGAGALLNRAL